MTNDENQALMDSAMNAAGDLAEQCALFRDGNQWPQVEPLDSMINYLMTELWDHYFSQSEIRQAFDGALSDMNRYAAGEERRP